MDRHYNIRTVLQVVMSLVVVAIFVMLVWLMVNLPAMLCNPETACGDYNPFVPEWLKKRWIEKAEAKVEAEAAAEAEAKEQGGGFSVNRIENIAGVQWSASDRADWNASEQAAESRAHRDNVPFKPTTFHKWWKQQSRVFGSEPHSNDVSYGRDGGEESFYVANTDEARSIGQMVLNEAISDDVRDNHSNYVNETLTMQPIPGASHIGVTDHFTPPNKGWGLNHHRIAAYGARPDARQVESESQSQKDEWLSQGQTYLAGMH